jgi:hypothetical protein
MHDAALILRQTRPEMARLVAAVTTAALIWASANADAFAAWASQSMLASPDPDTDTAGMLAGISAGSLQDMAWRIMPAEATAENAPPPAVPAGPPLAARAITSGERRQAMGILLAAMDQHCAVTPADSAAAASRMFSLAGEGSDDPVHVGALVAAMAGLAANPWILLYEGDAATARARIAEAALTLADEP